MTRSLAAMPREGMRPSKNPSRRANRHWRWPAYHACRARTRVRRGLVTSMESASFMTRRLIREVRGRSRALLHADTHQRLAYYEDRPLPDKMSWHQFSLPAKWD